MKYYSWNLLWWLQYYVLYTCIANLQYTIHVSTGMSAEIRHLCINTTYILSQNEFRNSLLHLFTTKKKLHFSEFPNSTAVFKYSSTQYQSRYCGNGATLKRVACTNTFHSRGRNLHCTFVIFTKWRTWLPTWNVFL